MYPIQRFRKYWHLSPMFFVLQVEEIQIHSRAVVLLWGRSTGRKFSLRHYQAVASVMAEQALQTSNSSFISVRIIYEKLRVTTSGIRPDCSINQARKKSKLSSTFIHTYPWPPKMYLTNFSLWPATHANCLVVSYPISATMIPFLSC